MTGRADLFTNPTPTPNLVSAARPCRHPVVDVHEGRATCLTCGPISPLWLVRRDRERMAEGRAQAIPPPADLTIKVPGWQYGYEEDGQP